MSDAGLFDQNMIASVFEERAEHLSFNELDKWTVESSQDSKIMDKLIGPGAKLLSGPRGSGKSSYLRRAYFHMLNEGKSLPSYVNFSKSLALEPIFHRRTDASIVFRQWVVAKILVGFIDAVKETGAAGLNLTSIHRRSTEFIHCLERGDEPPEQFRKWATSELMSFISASAEEFGFKKVILLLDDAAHAFSADQQREFFEVFRELRSRKVSCKAAVYPGITSYSPNFHMGHDAELVNVWHDPTLPSYLEFMRKIINQRLPREMADLLNQNTQIIDYLAFAACGLPRSFLVMVSSVLKVDSESPAAPKRTNADKAVTANAQSVNQLFSSLARKLPRYRNFIEVGQELIQKSNELLRNFNRNRGVLKKAVVVALSTPLDQELERILGLLEYAGVVRNLGTVSRGVKGVFQRYSMHYSIVIDENSLSLGQERSLENMITAFANRDAHAFARGKGKTLLGEEYQSRCVLDLAPCPNCDTPRISDDARFCMKCGMPLTDTSVYEQLLRTEISALPLTEHRISTILENSTIQTIQDVLVDEEMKQLRGVPGIGPVWSARIRTWAEEFVSV